MTNTHTNCIYTAWGFRENPFQTTPLAADKAGKALLVGREEELKKLGIRMHKYPTITCVEGAHGVGKTSVVNVAAYLEFERYLTQRKGQLLIPCRKTFQLTSDANADQFTFDVLLEVAQTLLARRGEVRNMGLSLDGAAALNAWINSPQTGSWEAGIASMVSFGAGKAINEGDGFTKGGLENLVREWLQNIFPSAAVGGVVCVIDNMELLQTSGHAKVMVEKLRDRLFTIPGLRWVFCGANGIISGLVSSPRMDGFLGEPVEIPHVGKNLASEIFLRRTKFYEKSTASFTPPSLQSVGRPYLPISSQDFEELYVILNYNLRSLLGAAERFCTYVAENGAQPKDDIEKKIWYEKWVIKESRSALAAVSSLIKGRAWEIFDIAVKDMGGFFSPSDFEGFGCGSLQALRPHVGNLESCGLLTSVKDDTDRRRKTTSVTSKGYLVAHARLIGP